jgi:hypothetical protein
MAYTDRPILMKRYLVVDLAGVVGSSRRFELKDSLALAVIL